jgi:hypothetical protein
MPACGRDGAGTSPSAPRSAAGWSGRARPTRSPRKRAQLEQALAKTSASINAMVTALSEQLITIDGLHALMPHRHRAVNHDHLSC